MRQDGKATVEGVAASRGPTLKGEVSQGLVLWCRYYRPQL